MDKEVRLLEAWNSVSTCFWTLTNMRFVFEGHSVGSGSLNPQSRSGRAGLSNSSPRSSRTRSSFVSSTGHPYTPVAGHLSFIRFPTLCPSNTSYTFRVIFDFTPGMHVSLVVSFNTS